MSAIILAAVLFLAIMAVGTLLGMRLWAKPKEAIERVTSTGVEIPKRCLFTPAWSSAIYSTAWARTCRLRPKTSP